MTARAPQCQPRIAEVLRLLQASSCFRPGSACGSLPCACAESLAALFTPERQGERIEELEAALRPFANIAQFVTQTQRDTRPIIFGMDNVIVQRLTIGHLRAAQAALQSEKPT